MSFIETPRFPETISYGATGGPTWSTDVVMTNGGNEYRNQTWSQSLCRYDVAHAARRATDYVTLVAFYRAMAGRLHGFRYKDWGDYAVTSAQGAFVLLTATTFQMYRAYTAGSLTDLRKIVKPVTGTVAVTGGASPSVDYTTGIVTVASGTPTAWSGQFDVPCRFDIDQMQGEIIGPDGSALIMGWHSIPIVELRL